MQSDQQHCSQCGSRLEIIGGLEICPRCNDSQGQFYSHLVREMSDFGASSDQVLIECHGATLYRPGTDEVIAGVKFFDATDPDNPFEIVDHQVFGPHHVKKRWVKKQDAHLIRRCHSCQDHTVRMRRKEGPDLYIPSRHGPLPKMSRRRQNDGHNTP
jgi:hypothetical protein